MCVYKAYDVAVFVYIINRKMDRHRFLKTGKVSAEHIFPVTDWPLASWFLPLASRLSPLAFFPLPAGGQDVIRRILPGGR
jgi:hypothetical protein